MTIRKSYRKSYRKSNRKYKNKKSYRKSYRKYNKKSRNNKDLRKRNTKKKNKIMRGGAQERTVAQRVAQLNAAALAEAAESAGKPVEEMGSKIVVLMDDTGESEELCREALIESRGNKQWAEQIIHVLWMKQR